MAEKSEGKWSSEVSSFISIFNKVQHSFYGLLLLEIGWILLLLLIKTLTGGKDDSGKIPVPWVDKEWHSIAVPYFILPGCIAIFLYWLTTGPYSLWVRWGVGWITWILANAVLFLFALTILAINGCLLVVTWPIECVTWKFWTKRKSLGFQRGVLSQVRTRKLRATASKVARTRTKDAQKVQSLSSALAKEHRSKAKKDTVARMTKIFNEEVFSKWALMDLLSPLWAKSFTLLHSRYRIGISLRDVLGEEQTGAFDRQWWVFNEKVRHGEVQFIHRRELDSVLWNVVPTYAQLWNGKQAEQYRRLLGLDVLLWAYGDPEKSTYLNITRRIFEVDRKQRQQEVSDENAKPLFSLVLEPTYFPCLRFNRQDPWEVYVLVVLALLELARARRKPGTERDYTSLDTLHRSYNLEVDFVTHLARDILPSVTPAEEDKGLFPTVRQALGALVGDWVGWRIESFEKYGWADRLIAELLPIIEKCIQLAPAVPENYYRQGWLQAMKGDFDAALFSFSQAKPYEKSYTDRGFFILEAGVLLFLAEDSDGSWAKIAALYARAINIGGVKGKEHARKDFEESDFAKHVKLMAEYGGFDKPMFNFVSRLLSAEPEG